MRVHLIDAQDRLETTLRLRIEAVLHAEPAPESVTFDTLVDPTTDDVVVRPGNVVRVRQPRPLLPHAGGRSLRASVVSAAGTLLRGADV